MPKITASSPVLLVRDIVASANYYRDAIGFTYGPDDLFGEPPVFCILRRDGFHLMLALADPDNPSTPFWKLRDKTPNAYFWVDDADTLYEQMKANGAKLDYGPCTQPYGVREFGIQDLDEHDISFGQIL
ncbi:MAG: bleomycin resistance protein [Phycisphaera sp.]|nr:bleomycin resistance protein [Phycisphaera sp.]